MKSEIMYERLYCFIISYFILQTMTSLWLKTWPIISKGRHRRRSFFHKDLSTCFWYEILQSLSHLCTSFCKLTKKKVRHFDSFKCNYLSCRYIYTEKYTWNIGGELNLSPNVLFEGINNLQCYELTRRCSCLLLYIDFTIDLCSATLISTLWMCNKVKQTKDF